MNAFSRARLRDSHPTARPVPVFRPGYFEDEVAA